MVSPTHPTPSDLARGDLSAHRATVFRLPAVAASVRAARGHVRDRMAAWDIDPEVGDDATLVVSELVTNAVAHAFGDQVLGRVRVTGHRLRIEVEDQACGRTVPVCRAPDPARESGRGLALVAALALDWGVTPAHDGSGHVVWAELPLTAPEKQP